MKEQLSREINPKRFPEIGPKKRGKGIDLKVSNPRPGSLVNIERGLTLAVTACERKR